MTLIGQANKCQFNYSFIIGVIMIKYLVGLCFLYSMSLFGQQWNGPNSTVSNIDRIGNVGIGGDPGGMKFRVFGTADITTLSGASYTASNSISSQGSLSVTGNTTLSSVTMSNNAIMLGNVGIGTSSPLGKFHLQNGNFICGGDQAPMPSSLPATRFMWLPSKKAFQGGTFGSGTPSIGEYAFAFGNGASAMGQSSISIGSGTQAVGENAIALGNSCRAGDQNGILGTGNYAIAMGDYSHAFGDNSIAIGKSCYAYNMGGVALGYGNRASGKYATVMGFGNESVALGSTTIGCMAKYDQNSSSTEWIPTDPLFVIGNGGIDVNNFQSNAITVLKNAKTGINTDSPAEMLFVKGGEIGIGSRGNYKQIQSNDQWSTFGNTTAMPPLYGHQMRSESNNLRLGIRNSTTACIEWGEEITGDLEFNLIGGTSVFNKMTLFGGNSPLYRLTLAGSANSTGWFTSSDIRFKKDIAKIEQPLQKVMGISGYTYNFRQEEFPKKGFPATTQMGLIAQEVEKVAPEVVTTDESGYKGIAYSNLVPLLIEAIKVQQTEIHDLRTRLEKLEALVLGASNASSSDKKGIGQKNPETKFEDGITISCQPNPTAGEIVINFFLPEEMAISLSILDQSGTEISRLVDKQSYKQGQNSLYFNGNDMSGQPLTSGTYLISLRTNKADHSQQFVVVR
jgi:hypothetical protein